MLVSLSRQHAERVDKVGESFTRCCPNLLLVEKYLRATKRFSEIIAKDDKVCYNCYSKYVEMIDTYNILSTSDQNSSDAYTLYKLRIGHIDYRVKSMCSVSRTGK